MKQLKPASANPLASARPVKRLSRNTVLLILLAILLGAAAFALITHRTQQTRQRAEDAAFAADKARFAKVETEMAETYAAIVAAAGKPDVEKQTKNCSYIELKFEKGSLRCRVSYKLAYGGDLSKAAQLTSKVDSAISAAGAASAGSLKQKFLIDDPDQFLSLRLNDLENTNCELNLKLGITEDLDKANISEARSAYIYYYCGNEMKKPIYPLAN